MPAPRPQTIDAYIATFPDDVQTRLEKVRATIHKAAPRAQEKISYQMPAFTLEGKILVYFAAFKEHIGMYALPDAVIKAKKREVAPYANAKGNLRFPYDERLPIALVRDLLKLAANQREASAKAKPRAPAGKRQAR